MPTQPLNAFLETIRGRFPNLKGHDETRLFSVLLEAGFEVEFGIDADGSTTITHPELTDEVTARLSKA